MNKSGIIAHKNNIFGINGYHGDTSGIIAYAKKSNIFGINGYHGDTSGIIAYPKKYHFRDERKITSPYFLNKYTGSGQLI